jgi:prolyl oligopeptidase
VRANRYKVAEDFAAVAKDLVARGGNDRPPARRRRCQRRGPADGHHAHEVPELFGALVCQQPLLDMRRYLQLLAGASWVAEFGDPDDPADWAFIKEYSPYHNIDPGRRYPPVLITSSTRDDRVHPGHARKTLNGA